MDLVIGLSRALAHAAGTHNRWCRRRYCTYVAPQAAPETAPEGSAEPVGRATE